jgi:hypothetical protein
MRGVRPLRGRREQQCYNGLPKEDSLERLILYLAIYGAVLSTLVLLWDVIKYYKDKPSLRVQANHRALVGPSKSEHKIGIDMINEGKRPVTIVASGFKLDTESYENMGTVFDPGLPKQINEGQRYTTFVNPEEIDMSKILYAWAQDATGREHRSKKYPLRLKS